MFLPCIPWSSVSKFFTLFFSKACYLIPVIPTDLISDLIKQRFLKGLLESQLTQNLVSWSSVHQGVPQILACLFHIKFAFCPVTYPQIFHETSFPLHNGLISYITFLIYFCLVNIRAFQQTVKTRLLRDLQFISLDRKSHYLLLCHHLFHLALFPFFSLLYFTGPSVIFS